MHDISRHANHKPNAVYGSMLMYRMQEEDQEKKNKQTNSRATFQQLYTERWKNRSLWRKKEGRGK